jgi:hypothetical protein
MKDRLKLPKYIISEPEKIVYELKQAYITPDRRSVTVTYSRLGMAEDGIIKSNLKDLVNRVEEV